MDLDHLKKLVDAALEEGERLNDSGPAYDTLVVFLENAVDEIRRRGWARREELERAYYGMLAMNTIGKSPAQLADAAVKIEKLARILGK